MAESSTPSDSDRPARLSATLAVLVSGTAIVTIAVRLGLLVPTGIALIGGTAGGIAVRQGAGDTSVRTALVTNTMTLPGAVGLVAALGTAVSFGAIPRISLPVLPPDTSAVVPAGFLLAGGTFLGAFGLVVGLRGGLSSGALWQTASLLPYVTVPPLLVGAMAYLSVIGTLSDISSGTADVVTAVTEVVVTGPGVDPTVNGLLALLLFLAMLAGILLWLVLAVAPLSRFDDRWPWYSPLRRRGKPVMAWASAFVTLALVGSLAADINQLIGQAPMAARAVLTALVGPGPRIFLAILVVTTATIVLLTLLGRQVLALSRPLLARLLARTAAGWLLVVLTAVGLPLTDAAGRLTRVLAEEPLLQERLEAMLLLETRYLYGVEATSPTFYLFGVLLLGVVAVLVAWWISLVGLTTLVRMGVIPTRAGGFAIAAGMVFGAGTLYGVLTGGLLVVAVAVAAAMVVWDLGEYAVGLSEEMRPESPTTHGQLVHTGAAVGLGGVAVAAPLAAGQLTAGGAAALGGVGLLGLVVVVGALAAVLVVLTV